MWEIGRSANSKAPYFKYLLFISKAFRMDAYILKYPKGSRIDWHYDSAPKGYKHYRLNIVLKRAVAGGEFVIRDRKEFNPKFIDRKTWGMYPRLTEQQTTVTIRRGWFNLFRPDIQQHAVHEIKSGTRYVLSIGWLVKE